jgi:DHA1 family bicyclomycin/chloramphenicol resistance-like MFS transporter
MAEAGPAGPGGAPSPYPTSRRRIAAESLAMTLLLTTLVAFGALSNNTYLPSFPAMTRELGVPIASVLLTLSSFFIGFAVGQLMYGSASDRWGRRPVLLGGLAAYTVASAICALAPDIETLIAARFVQGLAVASTQVLARAIVRDLFTPDKAARMLSVMAAVFTLVPGFAPLAGGVMESAFGWRATFVMLTAIGAATAFTVWRGFGESLRQADARALDPAKLLNNYGTIIRSRTFLGYSFGFAFIFAGMFAFHSASSFVFIDLLGFRPEMYGVFFMIVVVGYFAGSVASARLTLRFGYRRLMRVGGVIAIIGGGLMAGLVFAGLRGWWVIVVPQFVFMIGTGLIMPNAIAGALAPFPEKAGAASALFGFLQQMTGAGMIALIGLAADGSERPMAAGIFAGACLSFAACCIATGAEWRKRKAQA